MLALFYAKMGSPPDLHGAVAAMAVSLAARATPEAIQEALDRCEFECFYPVRMPHIVQRLRGGIVDTDAEKRAAWEIVEKFLGKWLRWGEDRSHAHLEPGAPMLSDRILGAVRRSGGWSVFLRMTDADFPFVQERFFAEYTAAPEIERIAADPSRALEKPRPKELAAAKSSEPPELERAEGFLQQATVRLKSVPEAPSPEARRKELKDQREQIEAKWRSRVPHPTPAAALSAIEKTSGAEA